MDQRGGDLENLKLLWRVWVGIARFGNRQGFGTLKGDPDAIQGVFRMAAPIPGSGADTTPEEEIEGMKRAFTTPEGWGGLIAAGVLTKGFLPPSRETAGFLSESIAARPFSPKPFELDDPTGRSSNWPGKQRFDPSGLSPTQIDTAILNSIRRKSGATGTPTGQIAASADQVEFIIKQGYLLAA